MANTREMQVSDSQHMPVSSQAQGTGSLESISEQLSRIQRLQEDALQQKDRELELLRSQLEQQQRDISEKEIEIRSLERERYRQQENRALELGNLVRRGGGGHINPYQGHAGDESVFHLATRICSQSSPSSTRASRQPLRLIDLIHGAILFLLVFHFYSLSQMQPQFRQIDESYHYNADPIVVQPEPLKPWESKTPKPISLMDTKDPFVNRRHTCIQVARERQKTIFEQVLGKDENLQVLLVDPAYHGNVGDHMLTVGELKLIQSTLKRPAPQQCHYIQAGGFYDVCTDVVRGSDRQSMKVALWHAGGNWGDLWRDAQDIRIPSIKTILENGYKLVGMPQSFFYLDESLKNRDVTSIKEKVALGLGLAKEEYDNRRRLEAGYWGDPEEDGDLGGWGNDLEDMISMKPVNTSALDTKKGIELAQSRTIFMWREQESFEEASRLYPFVTNMVVPDMAFQLGPYAPIRKHPDQLVDVILFLRQDHESKVNSERNEDSIRRILPKPDMTFKIVDWPDRLDIFGTTDTFFTETSIELLSLGKVVVCDRLHAAILSYLTGLPFVYIDQVSGKVTKTLTAALNGTDGCLDGEQAQWARAMSLQDALAKALEMIDKHGLNHGKSSFLRGLVPF